MLQAALPDTVFGSVENLRVTLPVKGESSPSIEVTIHSFFNRSSSGTNTAELLHPIMNNAAIATAKIIRFIYFLSYGYDYDPNNYTEFK